MAKNTAAQIKVIGINIEHVAGVAVRRQVMQGSDKITASTKPAMVAEWTKSAIERLDALVDEKTRNEAMTACGYNCALVNKGPLEKAKARRKKFGTEEEFIKAEVAHPQPGTRLALKGKVLYQYYTPGAFRHPMRCYCSLFRGLPEQDRVSLTYCQCSRGFVERMWEGALGRSIKVEILESAISGAKECKFAIHL